MFAALGLWMVQRPDGAFEDSVKIEGLAALLGVSDDLIGHGIGWACALMGIAVLAVAAKRMSFAGPAIRIDQNGIYWHSWSDNPIPWSNIAGYRPYSIHRQKMVGLTLHDPDRNRSTSPFGKLAGFNAMAGFGRVALSAQSTDKSFDEMLQAIQHHAARYDQAMREAGRKIATPPSSHASLPRTFGRRSS